MSEARRNYNSEFKQDAVNLSREPGKTVIQVATSLGIDPQSLYRWRRESKAQGELAFPGKGIESLTPEQKRIRELEAQLKDTALERDILKKAVGIFSKAPRGSSSL
jgi:transposase-like protein